MKWLRDETMRLLAFLFGDGMALWLTRFLSRKLVERLRAKSTDDLLQLLLYGMDVAFHLLPDYRKNIQGLSATYVFETQEDPVAVSVVFQGDKMHVRHQAEEKATARVVFKDAAAVRRFLFSEKQDVLDSVLNNEVKLEGNFNYIYRFGFLARDLEHRLLPC